jgi:deoxycytidine triphosphate deaminase
MILESGQDLAKRLSGVINKKYQVHRFSVDLTVKSIFEADPIGRVDFGGGEYKAAGRIQIQPRRERREDSYVWWDLSRGGYFVEFNETLTLAENEIAILEPDMRLWRAGGTLTPAFLRGMVSPMEAFLVVSLLHLQVRQDARIAHLRLFRMAENTQAETPQPKPRATSRRTRT